MTRKYRLRFIQISLMIVGILFFYYTYYYKEQNLNKSLIPTQKQKEIQEKIANQADGEVFTNIEYTGLDISGNRYILKSKKAHNDPNNKELVNLSSVTAVFYFKDSSILQIKSDKGLYNNITLDMNFYDNIDAIYEGTILNAQIAKYSNVNNNLIISEDVKINSENGIIFADKLIFDIKQKTLDIMAKENEKINANVNIK
tara:strand:+ start:829 stop:1428 length:600 start_codon:yes stop_codon:yes gene_type:complete